MRNNNKWLESRLKRIEEAKAIYKTDEIVLITTQGNGIYTVETSKEIKTGFLSIKLAQDWVKQEFDEPIIIIDEWA